MNKRVLRVVVLVSLISVLAPEAIAASQPKPGGQCKKLREVAIKNDTKFTCIKNGKRLVWNSGKKFSSPAPTPTQTPAPAPTQTPAPTPTPTQTPAIALPQLSAMEVCELKQPQASYFGTGFGFPRSAYRLKNSGEVHGLFLYVEFNDLKGSDEPIADGATYIPKFVEYYKHISYGKLNFTYDIYPKYLPIPKDSSSYGMNVWGGGDPVLYWQDGLRAAAPYVDFGKYDFVVVTPPSGIKEIIYGPSMPLPPGDTRGATAQKNIYNGLVGGADQRTKSTRWIWLAHEIGHDLGMEHQFSYDGQAVWDLMNNVYDFTAPEFLGWHRFLQGWLNAENVACIESENITASPSAIRLKPLSVKDSAKKMIVIKQSALSALVVEYRTRTDFDTLDGLPELEGVIVYEIDVSKPSNKNAVVMITTENPNRNAKGNIVGSLRSGESVSKNGIKISVLDKNSDGFNIQISRL